jgi:hypothetical protein
MNHWGDAAAPRAWYELNAYAQPGHAIAKHRVPLAPNGEASIPQGDIRCTCTWQGPWDQWGPHVVSVTGREPTMVVEFQDGPDADLRVTYELTTPPCFPEELRVDARVGEADGVYALAGPATHDGAILYRWQQHEPTEVMAVAGRGRSSHLARAGYWGEE